MIRISWVSASSIQNKPWHVYSKELQEGLYQACVLFDQNSGLKPRGKFAKNVYDNVKSEKIANIKPNSTIKMQ